MVLDAREYRVEALQYSTVRYDTVLGGGFPASVLLFFRFATHCLCDVGVVGGVVG